MSQLDTKPMQAPENSFTNTGSNINASNIHNGDQGDNTSALYDNASQGNNGPDDDSRLNAATQEIGDYLSAQGLTQSEQSKFMQHLAQYPALTAFAGMIASFPIPKIVMSNALPILRALQERSKPVTESKLVTTLDNQGDKFLDRVDKRIPALQKEIPSFEEVKSNTSQKLQDRYRDVYSSSLNHRVNNTITPVNQWLSKTVDHYLPAEQYGSDQSFTASSLTGNNTNGDATEANDSITAAPRETLRIAHEAVLRAQKTKYIAKILASLANGKKVSNEYYSSVVKHFGSEEAASDAIDEVRAASAELQQSVRGN